MSLREYPEVIQGDERTAARFRKFVPTTDPSQCWEWQSVRNPSGYGKFWLNGRTDLAHRVSYKLHHGPIPPGIHVRHTCDNPPCVNPSHLLLGTGKDNARDALERGRYRRGASNGRAKLTPQQVSEIRTGWHRGETQVSMARRFGVSRSAIQWVLNGQNWAGIGETP
ncbi:HNH endonuclease [Georgenia thermotolerans]|uniref:HNH endonuclease n=1 Tax=Georgenia thermotolerans TaxID=527326 RepID=UPI001263E915|nr:HNH endonuclease [Georgenia thermotolerans]